MPYIYKIINNINNKIYVGKTSNNINSRFKEHIRDSRKIEERHRPLYRAFNKYGIENFSIELIEETNFPEERERYWIEQLGSFKNGYNATVGGDGIPYLDYSKAFILWEKGYGVGYIAKILNWDCSSVSRALKNYNISKTDIKNRQFQLQKKPVVQIDLTTNEIIKIYDSAKDAEEQTKICKQHITQVCLNKRKTTGGFKWKYLTDI